MWTSYRLSGEDIFFLHFLFFPPPPPPAPVTHSFIFPFPIWALPPFLKSPFPITFSPFLLPYMPKICSTASKKNYSWKFRYFTSSPEISLSVQNHIFYADVCTPRQYRLRICNQCISKRIAVIFTAHTLWRATFCLKYELTSKKKNLPSFPSFLLLLLLFLSLSFFFCLSLVRGGGAVCPPPPRRYATGGGAILPFLVPLEIFFFFFRRRLPRDARNDDFEMIEPRGGGGGGPGPLTRDHRVFEPTLY